MNALLFRTRMNSYRISRRTRLLLIYIIAMLMSYAILLFCWTASSNCGSRLRFGRSSTIASWSRTFDFCTTTIKLVSIPRHSECKSTGYTVTLSIASISSPRKWKTVLAIFWWSVSNFPMSSTKGRSSSSLKWSESLANVLLFSNNNMKTSNSMLTVIDLSGPWSCSCQWWEKKQRNVNK